MRLLMWFFVNFSAEEFLTERIKSNEFLKTIINPNRLKLIIDAMYLKEYQADDQIIREGDFGKNSN